MTLTSDSLNKSLIRYQLYVLGAVSLIPVLLEIYCLSVGITTLFPRLFFIPVILAAYLYPRRGVPFAVGVGIIYIVILVLMGYHGGNILTAAGVRVVVYIGIAAVVSYLAYQLKKEALRYRTLFESAGTAMLVIDEDGTISSANSEMEKISGYSRDEVVGKKKWSSFVSPDDLKRMEEYHRLRRSEDQTAPRNYEFSFMGKGDRRVDAYLTIATIPETRKSIASIMDITAQKEAQNELRISDLWFKTIWDNIQAGIIVIDADTHIIVSVNHAAAEILGYTEEQIKGNICHKFICPAEVGKCPISDLGQNIDSSERIVINSRGEEVPVLKSVARIVVEDHEYFVENFVDIRELKEAQNELLAYIIEASLRIKNPAELIRDNMADILSQIEAGDTSPEHIKMQIIIQIKNTDKVVDNLRELDRAIAEHRKEIPDEFRRFLLK
ncbi:MAG: PAS domain S-box protein [Methanogenium sp.]|nr:PAS domain S-box protein [Methanogenium sp.]